MIIAQNRVISVEPLLKDIEPDEQFYVVAAIGDKDRPKLELYGFDINTTDVQELIPRPIRSYTRYNAEGKWKIHKDRPKESRTFEREYHCVDWHGNDHYGTCFQTRQCYQRTRIPPMSIELQLKDNLLLSPKLRNTAEDYKRIKLCMNLLLEIIGYCETRKLNLLGFVPLIPEKRVPWTILPIGKYPWNQAEKALDSIFVTARPNTRIIIKNRHEHIWTHHPDFIARGESGFWGYIVYGFSDNNIFLFESNRLDNATYIFEGDWEAASKLTKAEILCGGLQKARFVHNERWTANINSLF